MPVPSDFTVEIRRITPVRAGAGLQISLDLTSGGECESRSMVIAVEDYAALRFLHPYEKAAGRQLDLDQLTALDEAAERFAAIEQGLRCLAYGDSTESGLTRKLREKGYSAETAANAAATLRLRGYINEVEQIERFLAAELRKGRGESRILAAAREKRYGDEALTHLRDLCGELDFTTLCAAVIEKKYGRLPTDPDARRKAAAALMRQGYSWSVVRAADAALAEEDSCEV